VLARGRAPGPRRPVQPAVAALLAACWALGPRLGKQPKEPQPAAVAGYSSGRWRGSLGTAAALTAILEAVVVLPSHREYGRRYCDPSKRRG
jgi:hypothetical protein